MKINERHLLVEWTASAFSESRLTLPVADPFGSQFGEACRIWDGGGLIYSFQDGIIFPLIFLFSVHTLGLYG